MKLYYSKGFCSLSVRIIINELKLPCKYVSVNFENQQTEDGTNFLTINPKNRVPALILDNGEILTECINIHIYLAEKENAFQLLPEKGDIKRYHVLEWMSLVNSDLHQGCISPLFNTKIPKEIKEENFKPSLLRLLNLMNDKLKTSKYLASNHFTLADAYLFVALNWLPYVGVDIQKYSLLNDYINHITEREAVKKSMQEEELSIPFKF